MGKNNRSNNRSAKAARRVTVSSIPTHDLRNREIAETRALRAELEALRPADIKIKRERLIKDPINCPRLYTLPGLKLIDKDYKMKNNIPRVQDPNGYTIY
jgi:hypothetical protein